MVLFFLIFFSAMLMALVVSAPAALTPSNLTHEPLVGVHAALGALFSSNLIPRSTDSNTSPPARPSQTWLILALSCGAAILGLGSIAAALYITNYLRSGVLNSDDSWELIPRAEKQEAEFEELSMQSPGPSSSRLYTDDDTLEDVSLVPAPKDESPEMPEIEHTDLVMFVEDDTREETLVAVNPDEEASSPLSLTFSSKFNFDEELGDIEDTSNIHESLVLAGEMEAEITDVAEEHEAFAGTSKELEYTGLQEDVEHEQWGWKVVDVDPPEEEREAEVILDQPEEMDEQENDEVELDDESYSTEKVTEEVEEVQGELEPGELIEEGVEEYKEVEEREEMVIPLTEDKSSAMDFSPPTIFVEEVEIHPDPDFLPLPVFEISAPSGPDCIEPVLLPSPPPTPPRTPARRPLQLPSNVTRPAWSVRAADAPVLSVSPRPSSVELPSTLPATLIPTTELSMPPSPTKPSADVPVAKNTTSSSAVLAVNTAGTHRRKAYRSPVPELDIALAMQLRPGLGATADGAWMVRFLMTVFGWFTIALSGGMRRRAPRALTAS